MGVLFDYGNDYARLMWDMELIHSGFAACRTSKPAVVWSLALLVLLAFGPTAAVAGGVEAGSNAYGENIGWISFSTGDVTVSETTLTGHAWGENIGWINLSPLNGGVRNDGVGRLSGFAWGENVGWIDFGPAGQGVTIDTCGHFAGTAWGENVGWLSFRSDPSAATQFGLHTSWRPPDIIAPAMLVVTTGTGWQKSDVAVTLVATDNDCGAGVREIRYALDANPEIVQAGGTAALTVATEGSHLLRYYAVDQSGNQGTPDTLAIQIDKTPPQVSLSAPANGATYFINQSIPAAYSAMDSLSGIASLTGTVPSGGKFNTANVGAKSFAVSAIDAAGNALSVVHRYTIVYPGNIGSASAAVALAWGENVGWINFKPAFGPGVTVGDAAVSGMAWGENTGWINLGPFSGSVANDGTGNLSGYAWAENVGWIDFRGVSIDANTGAFRGAAWGENVGWVRFDLATDGAITSWRPLSDTRPPETSITVSPPNPSNSATASFAFTGSDDVTAAGDLAFDCQLDAGAYAACGSPQSYAGLAEGSHTFRVRARDVAGNLDPTPASFVWTVDTSAPTVAITSPANGAVFALSQASAASYACTDAVSGVSSCTGSVPNGANIDTASVGMKAFAVTATDAAGNRITVSAAYGVSYSFAGFLSPVDNLPTLNRVRAGSAVPVKFSVGGNQGLMIMTSGYPTSAVTGCDSSAPVDAIEETFTTGSSSLSYDASTDQYTYVWKTEKSWAGSCRQLVVGLKDGTYHRANFTFTK